MKVGSNYDILDYSNDILLYFFDLDIKPLA
jgi:hypothetical protein